MHVAAMSALLLRLLGASKEQLADSTDGSTSIPGLRFGSRYQTLAVRKLLLIDRVRWYLVDLEVHWIPFAQTDEATAREEARRSVSSGSVAYAKADVVVKLGGWDPEYTRAVAQGCLVALKQLTLADKKLAGTCSLPLPATWCRHQFSTFL